MHDARSKKRFCADIKMDYKICYLSNFIPFHTARLKKFLTCCELKGLINTISNRAFKKMSDRDRDTRLRMRHFLILAYPY